MEWNDGVGVHGHLEDSPVVEHAVGADRHIGAVPVAVPAATPAAARVVSVVVPAPLPADVRNNQSFRIIVLDPRLDE
jgi:hypothetical protein